jgi:hypothetical protein
VSDHDDLYGYVTTPPTLQPILKVYGRAPARDLAEALAQNLRIQIRDLAHRDAAFHFLLRLADPLADAISQHEPPDDRLARGLVRRSVGADINDLIEVISAFGWGSTKLKPTPVDHVYDALVDTLTDQLAPFVIRMLRRWHDAGHFGRIDPRSTSL